VRGRGEGRSKRLAERAAANDALATMETGGAASGHVAVGSPPAGESAQGR
jgi:hypothetical protein